MSNAWAVIGAWAAEAELAEAEEKEKEQQRAAAEAAATSHGGFPSLGESLTSKPRKKKQHQTLSLAEFTVGRPVTAGSKPRSMLSESRGLTAQEMMLLPRGPRERSREDEYRGGLGGGFPDYRVGADRPDRERDRGFGGAGIERERESSAFRSHAERDEPSRADENNNWAATKKPVSSFAGGIHDNDRRGSFMGDRELPSRADNTQNWGSGKKEMAAPPVGRTGRFEDRREEIRHSRADEAHNWAAPKAPDGRQAAGYDPFYRQGRADGGRWERREPPPREEPQRRRLVLAPRTRPLSMSPPPASRGHTEVNLQPDGIPISLPRPPPRSWERGDLLNRLSTFKSSLWFIMPKALGPLACARRGWENVGGYLISCEACGAHLSFSSPSTWSQPQVKVIAEAYSGQLDSGHKAPCPWKGNPCAESLAQFPPSTDSALIGGFDDRCGALLQFLELPVIFGSVLEEMKITRGPEIDRLLAKLPPSLGQETGKRADDAFGTRHRSMDTANNPYFEAQRIISLCGWEPRFLPYVVDCDDESTSYSTRKCQSVKARKGPSHRMCVPSRVDRMDNRVPGQSVMIVPGLKCDHASAVLYCNLCGATVCLRDFTTVTCPSPLSAGLAELPERPEKYTGALMRGLSAASSFDGWRTVEASVKEKDLRDEAGGDAITLGGQKITSHSGALDLNLTFTGGTTPTFVGPFAIDFPSAELAAESQKLLGKSEGSQMGGPAASYESFGPGFKGRRTDDCGSTVDRPQSSMHRSDSIEGTVVDLEGGEVSRKHLYNGEFSKRKRGGECPAEHQLSYGVAITDQGCTNFVPPEADIEVDNPDSFTRNQQHLLLQEIYAQRILLAQPAKNSVYNTSVIAVDASYIKRENSMESIENFPQDSDVQGTAFSWEKSDRVDDDKFNVLELAQQSTSHGGNIGEFHYGPSVPGISTSDDGGGDIVVENDAAAFSAAIGMGCGECVGTSGGSVQVGVSHKAEIHGADLTVHRMESLTNDGELITEVTGLQRQSSESVPDLAMTARFVPDNIEQENAQNNPMDSEEAAPSVSVARVYSGVKQDESGQGESREIEKRGKLGTLCNQTRVANDVVIHSVEATNAGGEDVHHPKAASGECGMRGDASLATKGKGNRPGNRHWQRERGGGFDPIHQHHHYCPWVNGRVAAAGTGESNLKNRLCGWQLTIDALDRFHMQDQTFTTPMLSESVASMHKEAKKAMQKDSVIAPIIKNPRAYANKMEANNAFKELLESVHVESDWTWDQTMRAIINDKRYGALKKLEERKQAFHEYVAKKKKQEEKGKCRQEKEALQVGKHDRRLLIVWPQLRNLHLLLNHVVKNHQMPMWVNASRVDITNINIAYMSLNEVPLEQLTVVYSPFFEKGSVLSSQLCNDFIAQIIAKRRVLIGDELPTIEDGDLVQKLDGLFVARFPDASNRAASAKIHVCLARVGPSRFEIFHVFCSESTNDYVEFLRTVKYSWLREFILANPAYTPGQGLHSFYIPPKKKE